MVWNSCDNKFSTLNLEDLQRSFSPEYQREAKKDYNIWDHYWTFEGDDCLGKWFIGDLRGKQSGGEEGTDVAGRTASKGCACES